jgi:hypothetical protein
LLKSQVDQAFLTEDKTKFVSTSKAVFKAEDSNKKTGENEQKAGNSSRRRTLSTIDLPSKFAHFAEKVKKILLEQSSST